MYIPRDVWHVILLWLLPEELNSVKYTSRNLHLVAKDLLKPGGVEHSLYFRSALQTVFRVSDVESFIGKLSHFPFVDVVGTVSPSGTVPASTSVSQIYFKLLGLNRALTVSNSRSNPVAISKIRSMRELVSLVIVVEVAVSNSTFTAEMKGTVRRLWEDRRELFDTSAAEVMDGLRFLGIVNDPVSVT